MAIANQYRLVLSSDELVSMCLMIKAGAIMAPRSEVQKVRAILDRLRPQLIKHNVPDDFIRSRLMP